jgi:cytochrome b561
MEIKNTNNRYGLITIMLHWIMAVLIIGLLAEGLYMVRIPVSLQKLKLFGWHKEYGMLVLILVCFRIGWRLANIVPALPDTIPQWQKFAARSAHWAFYGFMFAMPITGWLLTSASGLPVSFFGWITFPDMVAPNADLRIWFTVIHEWLGYGLIATICLHIGAALKHHFINKDNVLTGMLP